MSTKTRELMDVIRDGVKAVFSSQEYIEYLNFVSKFPHYSPNNIMLIYKQKPNASFVASYSAWKKLGGAVKRGSRAIRIIAPHTVEDDDGSLQLNFHAACCFDISQVYGVEIPNPVKPLDGIVDNYSPLIDALVSISPVPVEFEEIDSEANGYFDFQNLCIKVKSGMSQKQSVKTLLHEEAHAWIYSDKDENDQTDRESKEIQAESTAYIVSNYLGLDTSDYSFPYIASWAGDKPEKLLQENLETIVRTADRMIKMIDDLQGKEHEEC